MRGKRGLGDQREKANAVALLRPNVAPAAGGGGGWPSVSITREDNARGRHLQRPGDPSAA